MKNTSTANVMQKKQIIYTGLHARLFSALIDLLLASLLFFPIFKFISSLIYGDIVPGQFIANLVKEINENNIPRDIVNEKAYDYYIKDKIILKFLLEQCIQFIFFGLYFVTWWYKKQTTLGKICLSAKIVNADDFSNPSLYSCILRYLSYVVSVVPFMLGVISIAFNKRKQGFHDKIAKTIVIKS